MFQDGDVDGFRLDNASFAAERAAGAELRIDRGLNTVFPSQSIWYRAHMRTGTAFGAAIGQAGYFVNRNNSDFGQLFGIFSIAQESRRLTRDNAGPIITHMTAFCR